MSAGQLGWLAAGWLVASRNVPLLLLLPLLLPPLLPPLLLALLLPCCLWCTGTGSVPVCM